MKIIILLSLGCFLTTPAFAMPIGCGILNGGPVGCTTGAGCTAYCKEHNYPSGSRDSSAADGAMGKCTCSSKDAMPVQKPNAGIGGKGGAKQTGPQGHK